MSDSKCPLSKVDTDDSIDCNVQFGLDTVEGEFDNDTVTALMESTAAPPQRNGSITSRQAHPSGTSLTSMGSRKVKNYYRKQSAFIAAIESDEAEIKNFAEFGNEFAADLDAAQAKRDSMLAAISFAVNVCLVLAKSVAAYYSASYAVISSVIDSAVDVTSGIVIWITSRAIKKRDPYLYPRGRTRLEPIAIIIVSIIMAVASIQMLLESIQAIVEKRIHPTIGWLPLSIMGATIVAKFILMVLCYKFRSPSTAVLAQDHRNDCISNTVAIVCAYLAFKFWVYLDPIAAILVSVYIAGSWFVTGRSQINLLSGKSAKPEFINRIIKICLEHHPAIQFIDTVYAYHWGTKFLVEAHVVMDRNLTLEQAHDISEPLQRKIEALSYVERAFLHVDHEWTHRPEDEHKVV